MPYTCILYVACNHCSAQNIVGLKINTTNFLILSLNVDFSGLYIHYNYPDTLLIFTFQALFCIGHLCRVCPQLVPQLLVEYETELHLFNILFDYEENDFDSGDVKDSG